jgi:ABC-type nitrate/sulfonate/bicarbonate transport system permease component
MGTCAFGGEARLARSALGGRRWQLIADGRLLRDIAASLTRIAIGFTVGSALGIVLGVLMGSFRFVRRVFEPYVQVTGALTLTHAALRPRAVSRACVCGMQIAMSPQR